LKTIIALLVLCVPLIQAAATADWRSRSIYQVLTDRFARTDNSETAPCDTGAGLYCGGSFQGIINKLDYIQNLGFSAVCSHLVHICRKINEFIKLHVLVGVAIAKSNKQLFDHRSGYRLSHIRSRRSLRTYQVCWIRGNGL
jgi:hypothetical protein